MLAGLLTVSIRKLNYSLQYIQPKEPFRENLKAELAQYPLLK